MEWKHALSAAAAVLVITVESALALILFAVLITLLAHL